MQVTRRRRTLHHEQIPYKDGGAFAVTRYTTTHWPLQWHEHPELELTWIVRGSGLRYVGDVVDEFAVGDLILLGPGVPHSWSSEPVPGRLCESVVAQFPLDSFGASWRDVSEFRPLAALFDRAARGLQILGDAAITVRHELSAMVKLPPGPLRIARLLLSLAVIAGAPAAEVRSLARLPGGRLSGNRMSTTGKADPWAQLVRQLHDSAATPVAMAGMAARMGLSPPSFARAFRRRFGVTCTVYLTRIRLARVCRELLDPQRSVATVAFTAGFGNLTNFNRRFKEVYGITPSAWRRRQLAT